MDFLPALVASHPIRKKPYNAIKYVRTDHAGTPLYRVAKDLREIGASEALKQPLSVSGPIVSTARLGCRRSQCRSPAPAITSDQKRMAAAAICIISSLRAASATVEKVAKALSVSMLSVVLSTCQHLKCIWQDASMGLAKHLRRPLSRAWLPAQLSSRNTMGYRVSERQSHSTHARAGLHHSLC